MAEEQKTQEEPQQQEKKSKKKLLIIIVAAVVVLGGGGASAFFLLGGTEDAAAAVADGNGTGESAAENVYLISLDTFVVNLADPGGKRMLKITLRAETTDAKASENYENGDEPYRTRVRDRILTVLTSKTSQDLQTPMGKESLKRQLVEEINSVFPDSPITDILFTEFIVQ